VSFRPAALLLETAGNRNEDSPVQVAGFLQSFVAYEAQAHVSGTDPDFIGDPSRIRTCNPRSRNPLLYPVELWDRLAALYHRQYEKSASQAGSQPAAMPVKVAGARISHAVVVNGNSMGEIAGRPEAWSTH
jgi:hypothetical protein